MDSQVPQAVLDAVARMAAAKNLDVYHVELTGRTLRVMVEAAGGTSLGTCSDLARALSDDISFRAALPPSYGLEVSSPGVERRLYRPAHYVRAAGRRIRLRTRAGVRDGVIAAADETGFTLDWQQAGVAHSERFAYTEIRSAQIVVPDDALFGRNPGPEDLHPKPEVLTHNP